VPIITAERGALTHSSPCACKGRSLPGGVLRFQQSNFSSDRAKTLAYDEPGKARHVHNYAEVSPTDFGSETTERRNKQKHVQKSQEAEKTDRLNKSGKKERRDGKEKRSTYSPLPLWLLRLRFSSFPRRSAWPSRSSVLLSAYRVRRFGSAPTSSC
jgi:hypothetical protein